MQAKDIIIKLEELSPKHYACDWDNVGLMLGSEEKDVKKVMVVVDLHEELVDRAIKENVDMIITHHPFIFEGLKSINYDESIGRKIIKLTKNKVCVYSMHTNFDVSGSMAEIAADKLWIADREVLQVTSDDGKGLGIIGTLAHINLKSFAFVVKDTFKLENIKVYGNLKELVHKIAILPGAGRSAVNDAIKKGADVLITGDISHHAGIEAYEQGLKLIDAGHYGIEKIFIRFISDLLRENFEEIEVIEEEPKELFNWL